LRHYTSLIMERCRCIILGLPVTFPLAFRRKLGPGYTYTLRILSTIAYSGKSTKDSLHGPPGCNYGLAFYGRQYTVNHSHRVFDLFFFRPKTGLTCLIQN
jgi:hypothetical protein